MFKETLDEKEKWLGALVVPFEYYMEILSREVK